MSANTKTSSGPVRLNLFQKVKMLRGLPNTDYFSHTVRPLLYSLCRNDPEAVHELTLELMKSHGTLIQKIVPIFVKPPENLKIKVNGVELIPFGTSAGLDKNGEAFAALEPFFGFQESGTVILKPREGNKRPRVAVLNQHSDILNAQGFPSKGLDYFINNLYSYRKAGGKGVIYVSICGLPLDEKDAIKQATEEMKVLMGTLSNDVQGFVWNPFSPNTAALAVLRNPDVFFQESSLMKAMAPDKLRLVKIGPYEPDEKEKVLKLVAAFMEGGGHGVVTTNTKMIPKERLPERIKDDWGYPSAGRSGTFLKSYRMRSVSDLRSAFPDAVIIATGGISDHNDAYNTFIGGATMVAGYTPYTFRGVGLVQEMMKGVSSGINHAGWGNLSNLQKRVRESILYEMGRV